MMLLNNGLSGPPWGVPSSLASNEPFVHYTTSEIFVYKTDNSTVFYRTAEDFYELAMAHGVEEAFKVEVYYIGVALVDYPLRSTQCIMASSSRSEAVACLGELVLIDGRQYLVDGLSTHTVYHCRYSQQAHLAVLRVFLPFSLGSDGKSRPSRNG